MAISLFTNLPLLLFAFLHIFGCSEAGTRQHGKARYFPTTYSLRTQNAQIHDENLEQLIGHDGKRPEPNLDSSNPPIDSKKDVVLQPAETVVETTTQSTASTAAPDTTSTTSTTLKPPENKISELPMVGVLVAQDSSGPGGESRTTLDTSEAQDDSSSVSAILEAFQSQEHVELKTDDSHIVLAVGKELKPQIPVNQQFAIKLQKFIQKKRVTAESYRSAKVHAAEPATAEHIEFKRSKRLAVAPEKYYVEDNSTVSNCPEGKVDCESCLKHPNCYFCSRRSQCLETSTLWKDTMGKGDCPPYFVNYRPTCKVPYPVILICAFVLSSVIFSTIVIGIVYFEVSRRTIDWQKRKTASLFSTEGSLDTKVKEKK